MKRNPAVPNILPDLTSLWIHLDDESGGALYALRYECETNGWKPHLWAQSPKEGGPCGLTRVFFIGVDSGGTTKYFDTVLLKDTTGMAIKIKVSQSVQDIRALDVSPRRSLERVARGLN